VRVVWRKEGRSPWIPRLKVGRNDAEGGLIQSLQLGLGTKKDGADRQSTHVPWRSCSEGRKRVRWGVKGKMTDYEGSGKSRDFSSRRIVRWRRASLSCA
jgi:hypothetical protein